jgi:hypothetical protein
MMFYGVATTKEGKAVRIANLPETRLEADRAAREHCAKNDLTFEYVRPVQTTLKQPSTMQKGAKERFRKNKLSMSW